MAMATDQAMNPVEGAERYLTCPFDPVHQILAHRLQTHLTKCRKQHPEKKLVPCPFDNSHLIEPMHLDNHIYTCDKRLEMDKKRYVAPAPPLSIEVVSTSRPEPLSENWDDEPQVAAYAGKDDEHIVKKLKGGTPSERRKARMEGVKNYKPPSM